MDIYTRALRSLLSQKRISFADKVLVTCGGATEARILQRFGFRDVLITNLDDRQSEGIAPFHWDHCDAEDLPFADDSFDWGMIHAGLHHCRSPHRGLTELMRVCRKGVLVIESRDSLLMRLAVAARLTPEYEIEAVALEGGLQGGVRNTGIPNFIYRWTENEVRKTVESARPDRVNELAFFYGLRLPSERHTMSRLWKRAAVALAGGVARALFAMAPRQGNLFGFAVIKTDRCKPWVRGDRLDDDYRLGFDPRRYVRKAA